MASDEVTVDVAIYDEGFNMPLAEFISELQAHLDSVPEDMRKLVTIDVYLHGSFDDAGQIEISYTRPKSPEELEIEKARAVAAEKRHIQEKEEAERKAYEYLKAKFENKKD